jgi:hypothetical protein
MPQPTRTTAPASLTPMTGAPDATGDMDSVTIGTKPAAVEVGVRTRHLRNIATCRTPPRKVLLWTHLPAARHFRHTSSWHQRLLDDPRLLLRGPTTTTARSRQHLNPSESTLRVVIINNVEHSDSSKPIALSQTSIATSGMEEGRWSTAYGQNVALLSQSASKSAACAPGIAESHRQN